MIVINKRYYDYDYDNNTIIMFDADDETDSAMQMASNPLADKKETHSASISAQLASQSQSTETVPDELIKAPSSSSSNVNTDPDCVGNGNGKGNEQKGKESHNLNQNQEALHSQPSAEEKENDSGIGSVSWISSTSPKGSRHIPYAIQIAHSYTINKLEVQLTTLVDVATIQRQQQEQLMALQQQQYEYQQALQREHEAMLAQQQQIEFQQRYNAHAHAHAHARRHAAQALNARIHARVHGRPPLPVQVPPQAAAQGAPPPHVAMQHPPHPQPHRGHYTSSREMGGPLPAMQIVPDGVAYVGHRGQPRYPPPVPRPGHPVMVQKDRYHAK